MKEEVPLKVINAVYQFLVGDMVMLVGVMLAFLLLALINFIGVLAPIRPYSGVLLILIILVVLGGSLSRELRGRGGRPV